MVVCLCTGLKERDIDAALDAGARTVVEIGDACGAGLDCGGCHATLEEMLCRRSCEGCPGRNTLDAASRAQLVTPGRAGERISA